MDFSKFISKVHIESVYAIGDFSINSEQQMCEAYYGKKDCKKKI